MCNKVCFANSAAAELVFFCNTVCFSKTKYMLCAKKVGFANSADAEFNKGESRMRGRQR